MPPYFSRIFFITLLFIGLFIVKDYGLTTDEPAGRKHGLANLNYINEKLGIPTNIFADNKKIDGDEIPYLYDYTDRDYGFFFPSLLMLGEIAYEASTGNIQHAKTFDGYFLPSDVHYFRHLFQFTLFIFGLIFFYKTIILRWKDPLLGLIGVLLFWFSPRFFAEAFYNIMDMGLMILFIIIAYLLLRFFESKTYLSLFWVTFISALAISTRIVGIVAIAITLGGIILKYLTDEKWKLNDTVWKIIALGVFSISTIVICWPFLWENPIENFLFSFKNMSKFRWGGQLFYLGQFVPAPQRPWHYPLVWMLVTIPIAYLLLFFIGLLNLAKNLIPQILKWNLKQDTFQDILFFGLWFAPIAAVIVLKSVVYDGWRHLYFTYPFFLLFAIAGLKQIFDWFKNKLVAKIILAFLILAPNIWFIVRNHPNQQVYFNEFVQNPDKTFELDYWGASFAQGLRFVANQDKRDTVKIKMDGLGVLNHNLLPENDKKRLKLVGSVKDADYYLTHYRGFPDGDTCRFNPNLPEQKNFPFQNEVFNVKSGKAKILGVYKLR